MEMRPIIVESDQQPRRDLFSSHNHPKEMMNEPRSAVTMS
jgi:hypothetical protein